MKLYKIAAIVLSGAILLSGCNLKKNPVYDLPAGARNYEQKYYEDQDESLIEIDGRTYSFFGTLRGKMSDDSIRDCVGYLDGDKNTRIYRLMDDPYDNYIMVKNMEGIMEQPSFYRAMDTRQKDILTPSYIESLGYECWGSSGIHYEPSEAVIGLVCNAKNVKEIGYSVKINDEDSHVGGVRLANFGIIKQGEHFTVEIQENRVIKIADKDKPFTVTITFTVLTGDGDEKTVTGVFTHDMMLGGYLRDLEIKYDDSIGYYLYENI